MKFKFRFIPIICFFLCVFASCSGKSNEPRLYITDFYWALTTEECDVSDADLLTFQKLPELAYKNLRKLVGYTGEYIWLKTTFTLPY